jgi:hypothetical protein
MRGNFIFRGSDLLEKRSGYTRNVASAADFTKVGRFKGQQKGQDG